MCVNLYLTDPAGYITIDYFGMRAYALPLTTMFCVRLLLTDEKADADNLKTTLWMNQQLNLIRLLQQRWHN